MDFVDEEDDGLADVGFSFRVLPNRSNPLGIFSDNHRCHEPMTLTSSMTRERERDTLVHWVLSKAIYIHLPLIA